jgi:pyruvate dehydrogenase E1 component alpha subunit
MSGLSTEQRREALRRMLLIRRFEEATMKMREEYPGHYHVYCGQEATAVGVCAALRADDHIVTTHRNHGHNLARGVDPARALAEVLGKATGTCGGKGGTFHIMDASLGVMSASGIVAGSIPQAVGLALAARLQQSGRVAVAFFGDGALNEGAFHEAINLAALWTVPVVFVCEFNEAIPAYDTRNAGMAVGELVRLADSYSLPGLAVDGRDLDAVFQVASQAIERARSGGGATFVESRTQWYPGYQGRWARLTPGETDLRHAWEPPDDQYAEWRANDPILRLARELVDEGVLTRHAAERIDADVRSEIERAVEFARSSPWPAPETAYTDIYA